LTALTLGKPGWILPACWNLCFHYREAGSGKKRRQHGKG